MKYKKIALNQIFTEKKFDFKLNEEGVMRN